MKEPLLIDFGKLGDKETGFISVAQVEKTIPFEIKRVFWIYHTPESIHRGNHAHKQTDQVLIALHGEIKVTLENVRGEQQVYVLSSPERGLFVPCLHWRKLSFSKDAICLSIASTSYEEEDYIREYQEFLALNHHNH